jgi:hypothetical protein
MFGRANIIIMVNNKGCSPESSVFICWPWAWHVICFGQWLDKDLFTGFGWLLQHLRKSDYQVMGGHMEKGSLIVSPKAQAWSWGHLRHPQPQLSGMLLHKWSSTETSWLIKSEEIMDHYCFRPSVVVLLHSTSKMKDRIYQDSLGVWELVLSETWPFEPFSTPTHSNHGNSWCLERLQERN